MNVFALTATCGRHYLLERSVRLFLEQDYEGEHTLLIFNNSPIGQTLGNLSLPINKHILLYNQFKFSQTQEPYQNLGAIYNDILSLIPQNCDLVTHWDDDDLFLPNHISEGVKGYLEGGLKAYKPAYSWYRHRDGVVKTDNVLEPSIFVSYSHLLKFGYSYTTTQQHLKWVDPLVHGREIYIKKDGVSTLIYNWGDTEIFTYKTSGLAHEANNFHNYHKFSTDHGDGVITPWPSSQVQYYYNQIEDVLKTH